MANIFSRIFGVKSKQADGVENRNIEKAPTQSETVLNAKFQCITAKQIAADNGIEYIADAKGKKMNSEHGSVNSFMQEKASIFCCILQMMECLHVLLSGGAHLMESLK